MLKVHAEIPMVVAPKPKHRLLPVLVVLFLVSYGLMTMLIVEQGRTIDTQRYLIKELFQDSVQLGALKSNAIHKQGQAKARAKTQAQAQAQAPAPPSARRDKASNKRTTSKLQKPLPQKPPKDTSDTADERRSSNVL